MRGIQAMTLMLSMLLLAGCGIGAGTEGAYTVYCRAVLDTAEGSDAVYAISADAEGESDERIARMLLEQIGLTRQEAGKKNERNDQTVDQTHL